MDVPSSSDDGSVVGTVKENWEDGGLSRQAEMVVNCFVRFDRKYLRSFLRLLGFRGVS